MLLYGCIKKEKQMIILLKYFSIICGSLFCGFLVTKYLFHASDLKFNKEIFKPKNLKKLAINSIIPILMCVISLVAISLLDNNNKEKIALQQLEETINNLKLKQIQDSLFKELQRKQEVLSVMQEYYNSYYERDIARIDTFYVFPLEKFFTYKNIPKEKVNERIRFYFNHHKDLWFKVTLENTDITFKHRDTIHVSIIMSESKNRTIYTKIKMNSNKKIFSIGNSIMTNYYPEEEKTKINSKKLKPN